MPEQLCFPGFEIRPRTNRLFFAVRPDAQTAARIAHLAQRLRRAHGLTGRPLANFHVSLFHLGDHADVPHAIVTAAGEAASAIAMPPFAIAFDRAMSFHRKARSQALVLRGGDGLAALATLYQSLGAAMKRSGLKPGAISHFTSHMTLLYDRLRLAEQAVETIDWTAREFVLIHSLLGRTRHVTLARWPLRG